MSWLSFSASLNQVGDVIFRAEPRYDTPWGVSLLALAVLVAISLWVLERRDSWRGDRHVSDAVVSVTALSKWYGQVIGLNDVTVAVPPGITGLLGPNGAGKSTLLKLVTGQLRPSKGQVHVLGEPIWGNPAIYRRIGYCPDQDAFYERMTGLEWMSGLLRLHRIQG